MNIEEALQVMLAVIPRGLIVIEHMEGIAVRKIRINAIPREAAAQPVGAVVHGFHRSDDGIAADFAALLVENARDGAPAGNAHLPFHRIACAEKG